MNHSPFSFIHSLWLYFYGASSSSLRGVHPPEAMMHFPLCFRFPLFSTLPFPEKISDDLFLLTDHNFFVFPVLVGLHFPSDSRKFIISSTFQNFPPVFQK